ncbi:MAG: hypothetical protein UT36_C0007G0014 [Candidatus Peregrinibacteria bacterium GW2011_GWF2_39_17]|nr:MAG: hypothetical protein UT36_C0007G0014 [Candidatus Peregrinibacteria bacterium GW2011_GWF2_39_17]HCW31918.1 copper-binding protein [Candidatus Peregrinibacteria bacterium]
MFTTNFRITNLECEACVKLSIGALQEISGVDDASVELKTGLSKVISKRQLVWEEIVNALKAIDKTVDKIHQ